MRTDVIHSDMNRRQLSRLPVRTASVMPEQPYSPPIVLGTITKNLTTGATNNGAVVSVGDDVLINEFGNADETNTILVPTSNVSITGWSGNAASIDESPWGSGINLTDFISTSTPNATARFAFTDLPASANSEDPVYSVIIALVARRTGGGSLNLETIQIVNGTNTAEWTDPDSMSLSADWTLATLRQQIIGTPTRTNWNDANLKFKSDSGSGGTVEIAAAAIRVKFRLSNSAPAAALTNVFRAASVRIEATAVGKRVYYHHFPWGYEIIRAEP